MIVVITSWAPTVALRKPAIPAMSAPANVPTTRARTTWRTGLIPSNDDPSQTARIAPDMY